MGWWARPRCPKGSPAPDRHGRPHLANRKQGYAVRTDLPQPASKGTPPPEILQTKIDSDTFGFLPEIVEAGYCAPSVLARFTTCCPTVLPSIRPWFTSNMVWIAASNVDIPASVAWLLKFCASFGNR